MTLVKKIQKIAYIFSSLPFERFIFLDDSAINYLEFLSCRLCVVWIGSHLGFSSRCDEKMMCDLDVDFTLFQ